MTPPAQIDGPEWVRALVEAAFREGYRLGYSDGLTDGHPLGGSSRDEDAAWRDSDAKAAAPQPKAEGFPLFEFTTLLMCSDPWPVQCFGHGDGYEALTALADREAYKAGFDGWIDAYHSLLQPSPPATEGADHE